MANVVIKEEKVKEQTAADKNGVRRGLNRILIVVLVAVCAVFAWGCGDSEGEDTKTEVKSPDLKYYDNGYGTYFVIGTQIAHPADQSSSIVVDWSREKAAKVSKNQEFVEEKHIVYSHSKMMDGREEGQPLDLHLNLLYAADGQGTAGTLRPVILLVPGGGFITCRIDDKYVAVQKYLAAHGYAVAIMQYHIIGQGRYMDAAKDVWEAVSWIREHGREHGLDPDRIALMGNSAGGYVAALAACQGAPEAETGEGDTESAETDADASAKPNVSTDADTSAEHNASTDAKALPKIRCVVNFYGLSDLINNKADYEDAAIEAHHKPKSSDSQFVNGALSGKSLTDDPEEAEKANPAAYLDGDEPPFLHFHGDADLWVSPSQSVHLHDALQKAGVETTRYSAVGASHGDPAFRTKKCLDLTLEFLDKYCETR